MTFNFAAAWAAAWAGLLFLIFMLDMIVGPFTLRWVHTENAFALGAGWAAITLGPAIWVAVSGDR